ncbi:hypothetical protein [Pseudonocardia acaciae]|uniref:hypothetical protein n=1 Tax=Pseudonocardia acaciae TaxID=551276 RepID=UPI0012ED75B8|nr:hypothetical protein [Pseudonocardia acaciae]
MLMKVVIASAAAVVATLGAVGVAHATGAENSPDCSSHEKTKQVNKGTQVIGNTVVKHINGGIAGSIEKPGLCPSIGNDNRIG